MDNYAELKVQSSIQLQTIIKYFSIFESRANAKVWEFDDYVKWYLNGKVLKAIKSNGPTTN